MKNENKIVIFDWGGVIEIENSRYNKYTISNAITDIMKYYNCPLTNKKIIKICSNENKLIVNNDEQTTINWFNSIKTKLKITCTYEEYKNAYYEYGKKISYYKDVVEYAHSLREKCNIGIFSSLIKLDGKRINDQVDLSMFDYVFLSYEIGYDKCDIRAYEFIEKKLNMNPENILFIDDIKANIKKAKSKGWNTCNAFGNELDKIKKNVKEFLEN